MRLGRLIAILLLAAPSAAAWARSAPSSPPPPPAAPAPAPHPAPAPSPGPAPETPPAASAPEEVPEPPDAESPKGIPPRELSLGTMKVITGGEFYLPEGGEARGDVYALVNKARVEGQIEGDFLVAGGTVLVPGRVEGDLDAAGAEVKACGAIGRRLRSFAATTRICGEVGADAVVFGFSFVLEPGAVVRGSLAVFTGNAKLEGTVDGPAYIGAGQVEIDGKISGDVTVKCDELKFGPAARLEGNLVYESRSEAQIPPGVVAGTVTRKVEAQAPPSARSAARLWFSTWFGVALRAWLAFVALIAGGLLLLFFRPLVDGALARTVEFNQLAVCFGIGLVTLLAMLVVGILCCVLFPLVLAVWSALGALVYFGGIVGKMALGRWALRPLRVRAANPLAGLLVGVGLLFVISLIPILGDLFWFVVTITGMGAGIMQVRDARAKEMPPPPVAVPGL